MSVTSHILEAFLKCPTKCFLRALGETGLGNPYADWVSAQNASYLRDGIRTLKEGVANSDCITGPLDIRTLKSGTWRLATDSKVSAQSIESTLHAVERVRCETPGELAQLIPTRFIFTNKLGRHDRLLLAFDALVLSEALGREPGLGKIIHGDDRTVLKLKTASMKGDLRNIIDKIATLLSHQAPPDLVLNRHCPECEFQRRCTQKAIEEDDLSLLAGITEEERSRYRSKGIFTVRQ
jgi:predicted RecB family nuclease